LVSEHEENPQATRITNYWELTLCAALCKICIFLLQCSRLLVKTVIPIAEMEKQKHKEEKQLVQGYNTTCGAFPVAYENG
jgi:hypothetical protein